MLQYNYNAWGEHTVSGTQASTIGAKNPFRYRSYFYDTETGLYFLKTKYYDPQIGRFLNMDSVDYADPTTINGLNLYAYCGNNPVMNVDPNGNVWWNWLIIGLQAIGGIVACFVPGGQAIGISLLVGAAIGMVTQFVDPAVAQVIGGFTSMANGASAFSTGISLLGAGPVGIVAGISLMAVGAATIAFGANEIVAGVTGTNYIQKWTGMGDTAYGWTYAGLNFASSIGQLAGQKYLQNYNRDIIYNPNGTPKQYRYYRNSEKWYDVDFNHGGKVKFPHWHGWVGNQRTTEHMSYLQFIVWLFRNI